MDTTQQTIQDYETGVRNRWPNAFLLRVEDEPMSRILPNGCYALVDPCSEVEVDHHPYAVRVGDLDTTVKRVRRIPGGLRLAPDSNDPPFRPQDFYLADQSETTLSVIGRVVWRCLPLRLELLGRSPTCWPRP